MKVSAVAAKTGEKINNLKVKIELSSTVSISRESWKVEMSIKC